MHVCAILLDIVESTRPLLVLLPINALILIIYTMTTSARLIGLTYSQDGTITL